MKKLFVIVFALVLHAGSVYGCLSASQNRIFPLGTTSKGLLVVETHLNRSEYRSKTHGGEIELKPAWGGICYFKIYDGDLKETYSEVLDTLNQFEQKFYDSIVGRVFAKGMAMAEQYAYFVPAKPMSISFCDYQQSCSKAAISFDTLKNKVFIRLSNKKTYPVKPLTDSASIASNVLSYYIQSDDRDVSATILQDILYINSVRQFQIGNKRLTIVHIGSGQVFNFKDGSYPPGKEYAAKFPFSDISQSVFEEHVLHHGHGFDFAIWE
jgi:hypothetical protein